MKLIYTIILCSILINCTSTTANMIVDQEQPVQQASSWYDQQLRFMPITYSKTSKELIYKKTIKWGLICALVPEAFAVSNALFF